jgi:hypothetical protein
MLATAKMDISHGMTLTFNRGVYLVEGVGERLASANISALTRADPVAGSVHGRALARSDRRTGQAADRLTDR